VLSAAKSILILTLIVMTGSLRPEGHPAHTPASSTQCDLTSSATYMQPQLLFALWGQPLPVMRSENATEKDKPAYETQDLLANVYLI